jgi:hypothetical protein
MLKYIQKGDERSVNETGQLQERGNKMFSFNVEEAGVREICGSRSGSLVGCLVD